MVVTFSIEGLPHLEAGDVITPQDSIASKHQPSVQWLFFPRAHPGLGMMNLSAVMVTVFGLSHSNLLCLAL
jgi:hypothetical protein